MKRTVVLILTFMLVLSTICMVSAADIVKFTMNYDDSQGTLSFGGVVYKNGGSFEIYAKPSIAITVTPEEGYSVDTVTVDSDPNAYYSGGCVYLSAQQSTNVTVTFKKDVAVVKFIMHYDETQGTVSYGGVEYKNGGSLARFYLLY